MPLQLWVSAIEVGCFFSLLALSFLLVLRGAAIFNFAIGPYAMIAGLATSWLVGQHGMGVLLAALIGLTVAVAMSVTTEFAVIRPIEARLGGGDLPVLVALAATLFLVEQLAGTVFGRQGFPGRPLLDFAPVRLAGLQLGSSQLLIMVVTVVVFAVAAWWLRGSRSGRMLRAVGDNKDAARVLGLPVTRVRVTAFVLAGTIAGLAGLLFAPKAGVTFTSGLQWTLWGFLAMVIGGTGSIWAPLAGGMLLAVLQIFTPYYLGSAAVDYAIVAIAVVFFGFRPNGLFMRRIRT